MLGATSVADWNGRVLTFWAGASCKFRHIEKANLMTMKRYLVPRHIRDTISPTVRESMNKRWSSVFTSFRVGYCRDLAEFAFIYMNKTPAGTDARPCMKQLLIISLGIDLSKRMTGASNDKGDEEEEDRFSVRFPSKIEDLFRYNDRLGLEFVEYHYVKLNRYNFLLLSDQDNEDGGVWTPSFSSPDVRKSWVKNHMTKNIHDILWYIMHYGFDSKGISSRSIQFHLVRAYGHEEWTANNEWPMFPEYEDYSNQADVDVLKLDARASRTRHSRSNCHHIYTQAALRQPPISKFIERPSENTEGGSTLDEESARRSVEWGEGTVENPFTRIGDLDIDAAPTSSESDFEFDGDLGDPDENENSTLDDSDAEMGIDEAELEGVGCFGDEPNDPAFKTAGGLSITNSKMREIVEDVQHQSEDIYDRFQSTLEEENNAYDLLCFKPSEGSQIIHERASAFFNMFYNGNPVGFSMTALELLRQHIRCIDTTALKLEADREMSIQACMRLVQEKENLNAYIGLMRTRREEAKLMKEAQSRLEAEAAVLREKANAEGMPEWLQKMKNRGEGILKKVQKPDIARDWFEDPVNIAKGARQAYPGEAALRQQREQRQQYSVQQQQHIPQLKIEPKAVDTKKPAPKKSAPRLLPKAQNQSPAPSPRLRVEAPSPAPSTGTTYTHLSNGPIAAEHKVDEAIKNAHAGAEVSDTSARSESSRDVEYPSAPTTAPTSPTPINSPALSAATRMCIDFTTRSDDDGNMHMHMQKPDTDADASMPSIMSVIGNHTSARDHITSAFGGPPTSPTR